MKLFALLILLSACGDRQVAQIKSHSEMKDECSEYDTQEEMDRCLEELDNAE